MSLLDQLKKFTVVVADTGDFESMREFKPQDSTTNPSLILSASSLPFAKAIIDDAVAYAKQNASGLEAQSSLALDKVAVGFGAEILKVIPGRVSTELDARLSFDTASTIARARQVIRLYKEIGIDQSRVLVKIASTWEGLQAAKVLEAEGIHINMTLLFSLAQAAVAAEYGVTLVSPFVGRITDFWKAKEKKENYPAAQDPGVTSVQRIYNYYKYHGYKTIVMGASFRNKEQIVELAGVDYLTISPALLKELANTNAPLERRLEPSKPTAMAKVDTSEKAFRWEMNEDECAEVKLAEGIRKFAADLAKLEKDVIVPLLKK